MKVLAERDYSKIVLMEDLEGKLFVEKTLYPNKQFSLDLYAQSYKNVFDLQQTEFKCHIPEVYAVANLGNKLVIEMEYLKGYKRLEYGSSSIMTTLNLCIRLAEYGYAMIDLAPINIMKKGEVHKLIDLDTLVKISDLPEKLIEADWMLSWFGSRVIKLVMGGGKWQDAL